MNSFAKSWLDAAYDLNIRVEHPYSFLTNTGQMITTVGVYLPDFGSAKGTLLTCRFDSDEVCEYADEANYYQSALNPSCYEPYNRNAYIETLIDWGWKGKSNPPEWYKDT